MPDLPRSPMSRGAIRQTPSNGPPRPNLEAERLQHAGGRPALNDPEYTSNVPDLVAPQSC